MVPRSLFRLLQCPTCQSRHLYVTADALHCASCQSVYPIESGYIDLMPRQMAFDYRSKYVTEAAELAEELDYRDLAPPLLAAGVRNRALKRLLRFGPADIVLDNGCGNARFATWNAQQVGLMVGSDPATLFADDALARVALAQADSRILPFADGSFDKAFSIDILEHFPRHVIDAYLCETARILKPGGQLLIFSNTREPSPIQPVIDISRHIGRFFVQLGWYDFQREARRKSDHLKALETWEDVEAAMQQAGLRPVRVIFWNSLFTTLVEHVLMKLGEALLGRTPRQRKLTSHNGSQHASGVQREIRARQRLRQPLQRKGVLYYGLQIITLLMELDLWLLGWMRCGSYFLVVEKPVSPRYTNQ
ncbi:MAG: class I SAM-dependent methyltransferase [Chloroflexaceae bacterium]|nr:class I SAM-dependent methyltransferase [Chloroflexaceae bacterium]